MKQSFVGAHRGAYRYLISKDFNSSWGGSTKGHSEGLIHEGARFHLWHNARGSDRCVLGLFRKWGELLGAHVCMYVYVRYTCIWLCLCMYLHTYYPVFASKLPNKVMGCSGVSLDVPTYDGSLWGRDYGLLNGAQQRPWQFSPSTQTRSKRYLEGGTFWVHLLEESLLYRFAWEVASGHDCLLSWYCALDSTG